MKKIAIMLATLASVACTTINVNSQNSRPVVIQDSDLFERMGKFDYEIPHIPVNLGKNLIITADGQQIIYSSIDEKTAGQTLLIDIKTGKKDFVFKIPQTTMTERVEQILLSPNSKMLYIRTQGNAAIWNIENKRLINTWDFQGDPEDGIIYDDNKLYSMGSFYDIQTGEKLSGPIQIRPYRHASMSPNNKFTFLYGDIRFKTETFYNNINKKVDYFELGKETRHAMFSNDSKKLFVNHDPSGLFSGKNIGQSISVIDTQTVKVVSELQLPMPMVGMAMLNNNKSMLVASNARIYRISTDTYKVESDYDLNVTTSEMPQDKHGRIWFGTFNNDVGKIGYYDPETDSIKLVNKPTGAIVQIAVTNDGKHIAYGVSHENNKKITVHVEKILK